MASQVLCCWGAVTLNTSQIGNALRWRSALFRLASKEIRVRYKSPVLGLLWALLVPLAMSLVLGFIFGRLVPVPVEGVSFTLFLIVAMFPWNCVHTTIVAATTSIQDNGALVRKTGFPRQLIPGSIVLANLINFCFTLAVVCVIVWVSGIHVNRDVWLLPCAVLLQTALALGLSLLVSAWQVQFRDTKYLVEMALPLWFYLTPIIYPASTLETLGGWTRYAVLANPMAGLVMLYRTALLGWPAAGTPSGVELSTLFGWTLTLTLACLALGWWAFKQWAPVMADWVQG